MSIKMLLTAACLILAPVLANHAFANVYNVYITEFCSDTGNNEHYEFAEFTNVGSSPVDMTGWSEDDNHYTPNKAGHILTAFGTLQPGESAIYTEATPTGSTGFRAYWGIPSTVKVIGPNTTDNLSTTGDSVTLFDSTGTLVDAIDYTTTNGGSADTVTRNCPISALGLNNNSLWANSYIGDAFGSFNAFQKKSIIGNPGSYPSVPEPATLSLLGIGSLFLIARRPRSAAAV